MSETEALMTEEPASVQPNDEGALQATQQAYQAMSVAYDHFNAELFDGALPGVLFTWQRNPRVYGFFSTKRFVSALGGKVDEIALNPSVFATRNLLSILATLVHEMVHQRQDRFGTPGRRGYHNVEFASMMKEIGLQPSDTGRPGGKETGECMDHYVLPYGRFIESVEKLLDTGYGIPWYDRYPITGVGNVFVPSAEELEALDRKEDRGPVEPDGSESADEATISLFAPEETPSRDAEAAEDGVDSEAATVTPTRPRATAASTAPAPIDSMLGDEVVRPEEGDGRAKPTRSKFVCPSCADAAWGKPSLNLICGKCNLQMQTK